MGLAGEKSKRFAIRMVRLYRYLRDEKRETILSRQLLRSGTSIGANLAEAASAFSRNDFLAKVYIALKETTETIYWLELLYHTGYLTRTEYQSLLQDAKELQKMLTATTKTIRKQTIS